MDNIKSTNRCRLKSRCVRSNREMQQYLRIHSLLCIYSHFWLHRLLRQDLVRRMLKIDPSERASVSEVLNHFWMRSTGSNNSMNSAACSNSSSNGASGGSAIAMNSARDPVDGRRDSKLAASVSHMLSSSGTNKAGGAPSGLLPKMPSVSGGGLVVGSEGSSPTSSRPSSPSGALLSGHRSRSYSDTGFGLSEDMRSSLHC